MTSSTIDPIADGDPAPNTIAWAEAHGSKFSWTSAGDNHEPTHLYRAGVGWTYQLDEDRRGIILSVANTTMIDWHKAIYIMDDGVTARPFYVAGYKKPEHFAILHSFPTNFKADGTPKVRARDGRPVDYSNWMLGPSRAYHLKISPFVDVLNGPPPEATDG